MNKTNMNNEFDNTTIYAYLYNGDFCEAHTTLELAKHFFRTAPAAMRKDLWIESTANNPGNYEFYASWDDPTVPCYNNDDLPFEYNDDLPF